MKYRIKTIIFKNGSKKYRAQAKRIYWQKIDSYGWLNIFSEDCESESAALSRIEKHKSHIRDKIEIKYIN